MTVAAVILAAGASSRLGEPKQLLQDATGETLVHRTARDAIEAGASPVVVVTGANAMEVAEAVAGLELRTVHNCDWQSGLASSIACGVSAISAERVAPVSAAHSWKDIANDDEHAVHAVLLLTCDMPSVGRAHLQELMATFARGRAFRVASAYGTTVGVPAIIPEAEFAELVSLRGDHGAKRLLMRPDTVSVPLLDGTFDLDTPEDVRRWRESHTR